MLAAAGDVTVKWDSVAVFKEMDASSEQTHALKKGSSVYVDLRIDQGGRTWRGVRPSRQADRSGFVDCKSLERVGSAAPPETSSRGGGAFEPASGGSAGNALGRTSLASAKRDAAV